MSTAIATIDSDGPMSKYGDQDPNRQAHTAGATFHPRLQFMSSASKPVKRREFPENHFAAIISKKEMKDLGESFSAALLGYRYLALDFRVEKKVKSYYDPNSPQYKEVYDDANMKRPPGEQADTMAGAQFLLYVDGMGYITLLCSSWTLKKVAKKLFGMLNRYVTFGHQLYETGANIYEGPNVVLFEGSFELPPKEDRNKIVTEFINASGTREEEAEEEPADETAGVVEGGVRQR